MVRILLIILIFVKSLSISHANNINIEGKYNNFSKSQLTEIISDFPKPPVFDEKVKTRFGDFKYNKLDTFQKWNWIFEYSNYCQSDKFKEIFIYLVKNKSENELVDLIVNSKKFSITDKDMEANKKYRIIYSHFIKMCNVKVLDKYLVELQNLIDFLEIYKIDLMTKHEDSTLHQTINLDCKITNYNSTINNKLWVVNIVPQTFIVELKKYRGVVRNFRVKNIQYSKDRITFNYIFKNNNEDDLLVKNIFFEKSKKLNVSFNIPDAQRFGNTPNHQSYEKENIDIWGDCIKETINEKDKALNQNTIYNNKKIKTFSNSNKKIKNKITNKTIDAEDKCTEIGFKKGTYEYGKCVLKLLDLK